MVSVCVLHLTARRVRVWLWHKGSLQPVGEFGNDETGLAGFRDWLRTRTPLTTSILADLAEENFQVESLPRLGLADRKALIRTRLARLNPGTGLLASRSLGRRPSPDGVQGEERVLLTALTRPGLCLPWLTALKDGGWPCAGLYGVALAEERLARKLKPGDRFLLASYGEAGLRLSYFDEGRLCLSHLAGPAGQGAVRPGILRAEIERFLAYLRTQGLAQGEQSLACLVLGSAGNEASDTLSTPVSLSLQYLNLGDLARDMGLRTPIEEDSADLLWLHLLAGKAPRTQYAPAEFLATYRARKWRMGAWVLAALSLTSSLTFAGLGLLREQDSRERANAHRREATRLEQARENRLGTTPLSPVEGALAELAPRIQPWEGPAFQLRSSLLPLSQVLDQFPAIHLHRLEWSLPDGTGNTANSKPLLVVHGELEQRPGTDGSLLAISQALQDRRFTDVRLEQSPGTGSHSFVLRAAGPVAAGAGK